MRGHRNRRRRRARRGNATTRAVRGGTSPGARERYESNVRFTVRTNASGNCEHYGSCGGTRARGRADYCRLSAIRAPGGHDPPRERRRVSVGRTVRRGRGRGARGGGGRPSQSIPGTSRRSRLLTATAAAGEEGGAPRTAPPRVCVDLNVFVAAELATQRGKVGGLPQRVLAAIEAAEVAGAADARPADRRPRDGSARGGRCSGGRGGAGWARRLPHHV